MSLSISKGRRDIKVDGKSLTQNGDISNRSRQDIPGGDRSEIAGWGVLLCFKVRPV